MLLELIKAKTLLDEDYIKETCLNSNALYSSFYLPKKNGKLRKIYHPHKELKAFQRILHDNVLAYSKVHSASMAYSSGSSIKRNAERHSEKKFLLRMDFRSFFESISSKDVFQFCEKTLSNQFSGWDRFDSDMFTNFVCYKNSLVMGAVTSPSIANLILYEFDDSLSTFCSSIGVTYTRYADDMYFSTNTRNVLKEVERRVYKIVEKLQLPNDLKINTSKTYHSSKSRRRLVTGLVLTCEGSVSLGRKKKREVRSLIFKWDSLTDEEKQSLSGYLSYAKSIEPDFINRLCMKYGSNIVKNVLEYSPE
ncbi:RNA-directed DNA polymerase [Idiomarina loihiensis]|uniref:retron St85 family RNA-directed DNA polymerase n=1 Tax=Idiomarina TaxID=135575 RepID=UPI000D708F29|nr:MULTISPECIES: retron St85 family RNA-directed DNA polymerase [Idiomarina]PWW34572.1 RNA-directed DNA polymerase [Idiomarina loihiensis]TDP43708.1 RNA-directed DNA polymerase [Idiomarina loihiensis]TDS18461.1 RNA-directed DNA polymerase [Idiomarina sp. H2]